MYKKTWREDIIDNLPTKDDLLLVSALFSAVYGWDLDKISKMNLKSIDRWIKYAKKRITWGDVYRLRTFLLPREDTLWKKIKKTLKIG
jgi:hypothetical protein